MQTKKFNEADNTAVFTTKFVVNDKKEITNVTHEKKMEQGSVSATTTLTILKMLQKLLDLEKHLKWTLRTQDDQRTESDEMHVSPAFSNTTLVRIPYLLGYL